MLFQGGTRADHDIAAARVDSALHDDQTREAQAAGVESESEAVAHVVETLPAGRAQHGAVPAAQHRREQDVHQTTGRRRTPAPLHQGSAEGTGRAQRR